LQTFYDHLMIKIKVRVPLWVFTKLLTNILRSSYDQNQSKVIQKTSYNHLTNAIMVTGNELFTNFLMIKIILRVPRVYSQYFL